MLVGIMQVILLLYGMRFHVSYLNNPTEIRRLGELRPGCPACPRGTLLPSQSGDNLRCSNHPTCRRLAPRCPGCQAGYAIV